VDKFTPEVIEKIDEIFEIRDDEED
jgi:hypothetical protein